MHLADVIRSATSLEIEYKQTALLENKRLNEHEFLSNFER